MRRRRKRRRKFVFKAEALWFLLGLSIAIGLALSPLTSIRTVRIEGAYEYEKVRLDSISAKFRGRPALTVNPWSVESQVLKNPAVRLAHFRRNIFGRATLELEYRKPVGELEGVSGAFIDSEGQVFELPYAFSVPKVSLPESVKDPSFTVLRAWNAKELADVCKRVGASDIGDEVSIVLDSSGTVCLNTGSSTQIWLGDMSRLDDKFRVLDEQLKENPDLLRRSREIRLTNPDRPVYVPRQGATQ
ncbi:MAG: hypothetical protein KF784_08430 [Fimbriimonadaceae bacterium]|nr:hypothetical protein [Fimbriimonadaceae bacterium]